MSSADHASIDWSQLWFPAPRRSFTADEMARAGRNGPSPTLVAAAAINAGLLAFLLLQLAPPQQTARLSALFIGLALAGWQIARRLWWNPWRRPLLIAVALLLLVLGGIAVGVRWRVPAGEERFWVTAVVAGSALLLPVLLWFLVVWRAQQIDGRLRELAEREQAVEIARRLAAAQPAAHLADAVGPA